MNQDTENFNFSVLFFWEKYKNIRGQSNSEKVERIVYFVKWKKGVQF